MLHVHRRSGRATRRTPQVQLCARTGYCCFLCGSPGGSGANQPSALQRPRHRHLRNPDCLARAKGPHRDRHGPRFIESYPCATSRWRSHALRRGRALSRVPATAGVELALLEPGESSLGRRAPLGLADNRLSLRCRRLQFPVRELLSPGHECRQRGTRPGRREQPPQATEGSPGRCQARRCRGARDTARNRKG